MTPWVSDAIFLGYIHFRWWKVPIILSYLIRGNNWLIHILASLPPSTQWWQEVTDTLPTPSFLWLKLCVSMLSHNHVFYRRHAFPTPAFGSVTVSFSKHNSTAIVRSYLSTKKKKKVLGTWKTKKRHSNGRKKRTLLFILNIHSHTTDEHQYTFFQTAFYSKGAF